MTCVVWTRYIDMYMHIYAYICIYKGGGDKDGTALGGAEETLRSTEEGQGRVMCALYIYVMCDYIYMYRCIDV